MEDNCLYGRITQLEGKKENAPMVITLENSRELPTHWQLSFDVDLGDEVEVPMVLGLPLAQEGIESGTYKYRLKAVVNKKKVIDNKWYITLDLGNEVLFRTSFLREDKHINNLEIGKEYIFQYKIGSIFRV